jgi:hypothetical protein
VTQDGQSDLRPGGFKNQPALVLGFFSANDFEVKGFGRCRLRRRGMQQRSGEGYGRRGVIVECDSEKGPRLRW